MIPNLPNHLLDYSVIICTYNRAKILSNGLVSLKNQLLPKDQFEVIIVNNNSTDNTEETALSFAKDWPNFQYIMEPNQWLSQARNKGSRLAKGEILIFLDDDVIIPETYLDRVAYVRNHFQVRCWGGIDIPYYPEEKPVWVKDSYLQFRLPYDDFHLINGTRKECVAGFSFIIEKDLLLEFGGFDPRVGMKGEVVGYGEETFLQHQLHAKGIPIGYDPLLKVQHHMLPHKLKLKWYFEAAAALGKSQAVFKREINGFPLLILIVRTFLEIWIVTFLDFSKSTFRWVFENDFYWQNWLIESFKKIFKRSRFIRDLIFKPH